LNLVADKRSYSFVDNEKPGNKYEFGKAESKQFTVSCNSFPAQLTDQNHFPTILSRTGCDIAPFELKNEQDEIFLASFIWGDQVQRMYRLNEGMDALQKIKNEDDVLIDLQKVTLPDGLPEFLETLSVHYPEQEIVLTSSYIVNYLPDRGASLHEIINNWAAQQKRTILWIVMDRPLGQVKPPKEGWLLWQAHLWIKSQYYKWDLGWCHPHGSEIIWLPGFARWVSFWEK
jgi:hypothetical protein